MGQARRSAIRSAFVPKASFQISGLRLAPIEVADVLAEKA
jgi:hypothetical protein